MIADSKQGGFTLVETLVSLALLSVIAIFGLEAIRLQSKLDQVRKKIAREVDIQSALGAMTSQIESALPAFVPDEAGEMRLGFDGKEKSIQFVGLSDGSRLRGGAYQIKFYLREDHTLVASFAVFTPRGAAQPTEVELLKGLADISFRYSDMSGGNAFRDSWQDSNHLPRQVTVTLSDELSPLAGIQPFREVMQIETADY